MKLVVVGAGRVGLAVLEHTRPSDHVAMIERDPLRADRARRLHPQARVIEGDGADESVLRAAGAAEADAVIVATPQDPVNLMVAALARGLDVRTVVARVNDEASSPLFAEIGVTAVNNPNDLAADHLYHAFEVPDVRSFMPVGDDGEVITLALGKGSAFADKKVEDARFPPDSLLVAINRASHILIPTADLVLRPGDVLTLVTRRHVLDEMVGAILGETGRRFAERIRGALHVPRKHS